MRYFAKRLPKHLVSWVTPLLILLLPLSLASRAESDEKQEESDKEGTSLSTFLEEQNLEISDDSERIPYRNFEDWERIDAYHLLVTGRRGDDKYIITFKNRCQRINKNTTLAFKSHSNFVSKLDSIYVVDGAFAGKINQMGIPDVFLQACVIEDITKTSARRSGIMSTPCTQHAGTQPASNHNKFCTPAIKENNL